MHKENTSVKGGLARQMPSQISSSALLIKSRYPTIKDFQEAYATANIQAVALAPDKCHTSESSPALSVLGAAYGKQAPVAWLISLISQWQEQMPVQGKMPLMQVHLLADNIAKNFFYLKASEIMLFLARLTGGAYSVSWYGQINPDIIISTLRDRFLVERENALYRIETREQANKKETSKPITWEEHCRLHGKDSENPFNRVKL